MNSINKLVVINCGQNRASYAVAFEGHTNSDGLPITLSKNQVKMFDEMVQLGLKYGTIAEKVESILMDKINAAPNGHEIVDYLVKHDLGCIAYLQAAMALLNSKSTTTSTSSSSTKPNDDVKFLNTTLARIACRMAPASTDGTITDEMLEAGYNKAMEAYQNVVKEDVIAAARLLAEKTGLDETTNKIRLRGKGDNSAE